MERDDPLRETLVDVLTYKGYLVSPAKKGFSGLQMINEQIPNLVICSRKFADLNCLDVLRVLKGDPSTKHIPFIFLSSKPMGIEHQIIEGDASSVILVKPFSTLELIQIIDRF